MEIVLKLGLDYSNIIFNIGASFSCSWDRKGVYLIFYAFRYFKFAFIIYFSVSDSILTDTHL